MEILRQMNFLEVQGYLLYVREGEIVQVKSGTAPKLVQRAVRKAKHKDQLELGL